MEAFFKAKSMTFSRQVIAGHNVIEQVGEMCKGFALRGTALIVTGPKTKKIAGNKVKDILEDNNYEIQIIETKDADEYALERVKEMTKEVKARFLLGVGGGSKIDTAKLTSSELNKPFISIPTSASHDGIASPRASIKSGDCSHSIEATVPLGILADTAIISKAPYRLLASGCADVISNATAVKDWLLAHKLRGVEFSSSAATLAKMSAQNIIENAETIKPNLEESVWILIRPLIISGVSMCVANSSRPASGSEHLFSHALDRIEGGRALHGEQCGVGAIMMMYLHDGNWEEIRDALKKIGAPTTAKELGVSKDSVIKALTQAHKIYPDRYTILGDNGLSEEAAEQLVSETGVA